MMIDRRDLMIGLGVSTLINPVIASGRPGTATQASALEQAAAEAWIYSLPLIESANARAAVLAGTPVNTLFRLREPTTPATQRVTTPNNDTLNARAWIDLSNGPVTITLPPTGDRYFSVAMLDMYSNNFAVLGTRTTGGAGGSYTIVGPGSATDDRRAIRSPTPWMWVLIRLLTIGGDDLAAARVVQDGFRIDGAAVIARPGPVAKRSENWRRVFASAQRLMIENPPPATDDAVLHRIAPLGILPGGGFDPSRFTPSQIAAIDVGVAEAQRTLLAGGAQGPVVAGWAYPRADLGNFAQDYRYRAQTALNGFAALPVDEAMYLFAAGPSGNMRLDSASSWLLRLPAGHLPPVDAFWSLTAYEAAPDGQFFLFENALHRYSVGDRTPGLKRGSSGSIEIVVSRNAPSSATANWLPAPNKAALGLVFRCYRPKTELIDGSYRLPALERLT